MKPFETFLKDEKATLALAKRFAGTLKSPCMVYLEGPLGAGKTTFVRGVLRGLGFQGTVKSPTYTLVEPYVLGNETLGLYHFDLYRLAHPEELLYLGIEDYALSGICFVEWPTRGEGVLKNPDITCNLSVKDKGRLALLKANTLLGHQMLEDLMD